MYLRIAGARCAQLVILTGSLAALPPSLAATDVTLSALADNDGGANYDAYVSFSPNEHWTLAANVGHSTSSDRFSNFSGMTYGVSADVHNESFGARLGWRSWDDSNDFTSRAASGKFYWRRNELEVGLLLEQKDFSVDYALPVNLPGGGTRLIARTADFGGDGVGLSVSWYGYTWGGYLQFQDYSYDRMLNIALQAVSSGTARPALAAIASSVLTRSSGITDNEFSAGIDRSFARSGLRLDVYRLRDQIAQSDSTGVSLGYRYSIRPTVALEATLGGTDSSGYDNQLYGGLAVSFRH